MPLTTLIITDLTRMSENKICLAGVTDDLRTVRPKFKYGGLTEDWLFNLQGEVAIRPFARIQFDMLESCPEPPHTEDWLVRPSVKDYRGSLTAPERMALLERMLDPGVAAIFGASIHQDPGFYVRRNEGSRSLGAIKVAQLEKVVYQCYSERWDYRLSFSDSSGAAYRLGVTDLAFRLYLDHLRVAQRLTCEQASRQVETRLQAGCLYLRIGLARPYWQKHPGCCFLQINGVYSFPDYLDGRCFADFYPAQSKAGGDGSIRYG